MFEYVCIHLRAFVSGPVREHVNVRVGVIQSLSRVLVFGVLGGNVFVQDPSTEEEQDMLELWKGLW